MTVDAEVVAARLSRRRVAQACAVWHSAPSVEPLPQIVTCRSGVALGSMDATPRFCFVSVASPVERVLDDDATIIDRSGAELSVAELSHRLVQGEVAAVVTNRRSAQDPGDPQLPTAFLERRAELRRANVLARFLLRQIGLEEVSAHRGAHAQLYDDLALLWSVELSLLIDPAMMLTLGADRQRYVDANYTDRATDRLPRALGRLHDLGVRSYPRLVIA